MSFQWTKSRPLLPPQVIENERSLVKLPIPPRAVEPGAPQRRSTRLLNHIRPTSNRLATATLGRDGREMRKVRATGTRGRAPPVTNVGRVVSGNRKVLASGSDPDSKESRTSATSSNSGSSHQAKSAVADRSKEMEALSWLMDLFSKLATAHYNLMRYKCQEAVQAFNHLVSGSAQKRRGFYHS